MTKILFVSILALVVFASPAYAYLDPGTGSMIIQLVVAGVLGALFTIKTWWRFICDFAKRLVGKSKA
jgi:hypothetical protein